jgi:hypothetical protein
MTLQNPERAPLRKAMTKEQELELDAMVARHADSHGVTLVQARALGRLVARGELRAKDAHCCGAFLPRARADIRVFYTAVEFSAQLLREEWNQ